MKTDARVRYTRMIIKSSFQELLREKPVGKITVKEVCEKAEINRATFYKHYLDCYDLLDKIMEEALERFDAMLAGMEDKGLQPTLTAILCVLQENAALFKTFNDQNPNSRFTHKLVGRCFRYMELRLPLEAAQGLGKDQRGMLYAFIAGGVGALMEYWLHSGCQKEPAQVADSIIELTKRVVSPG